MEDKRGTRSKQKSGIILVASTLYLTKKVGLLVTVA